MLVQKTLVWQLQLLCAEIARIYRGTYVHIYTQMNNFTSVYKYAKSKQERDPDVARLAFSVKHKKDLQARRVAKRTAKWICKNVFFLYLKMNGTTPAIAVYKKEGKLEYRDIRCIQAAANGIESTKQAVDSTLASIIKGYDSDEEDEANAEDADAADEHDMYVELNVNIQGPSDGVDCGKEDADVERGDNPEDNSLAAIEVQRVTM